MSKLIKILWLAPNMNHYKSRFLNHLANDSTISLCVLSGAGREKMGDKELQSDWNFEQISLSVSKRDFGKSKLVKEKLKAVFSEFDWVMIPAEKKNILLFLYARKLRKKNNSTRLFSYNHPIFKSGNGKITHLDKVLTKFYFKRLDRIVFYTERSQQWAIQNKLVSADKAFWANNTIDTIEIRKHYNYQLPPENELNLLFIGRLISSKRIPDLIRYFSVLKNKCPNLKLDIIGDGPENTLIEAATKSDSDISWHGTIIDEAKIAPIMKKASLVFIPGHSGLSINHAFAYGRPYITLQGPSHAPELDYIDEGENGYVLDGDFESNVNTITSLLLNRNLLEQFCNEAKLKGDYLSVENWAKQMKRSLSYD